MHEVYLRKNPSNIFLFTTHLVLFVIPCRKAANSGGTGARQSATDSAQLVDQIRTLYESKPLAFKALYAVYATVREFRHWTLRGL